MNQPVKWLCLQLTQHSQVLCSKRGRFNMLWKTRLVFDDQFCFLFAYIHTFEGVSKCGLICFDVQANLLKDDDWIVHLDEETILTEGSVVGIVNFINEGKHQFGQGVITYVNDGVTKQK